MKYRGINLTKVKNLYTENCKTLMKETEDDSKKKKKNGILYSWIERINIVLKWPKYPKQYTN